MGNWRTVQIVGTCDAKEVDALRAACAYSYDDPDTMGNFHCLSFNPTRPGLCGLGSWPGESMDASGNLAERNYGVEDVAETLRELVKVAPSLEVKVHCGGDYEGSECIATVTASNGSVEIGDPEVERVRGASDDEIEGRLLRNLFHPGLSR